MALAGGGSKGIYQVGAWRALSELGIEWEAVCGTSIGAVNAAFMAQNDWEKAAGMWENLTMDQCIRLPENAELVSNNLLERKHTRLLLREVVEHGGIDQTPLRGLLEKYIDVNDVYDSSIDFGLCTYALRERSGVKLWKEDIPREDFFQYILASSALPGLRPIRLDNQIYLDGGLADNLPIDMLRAKGFRNILAIDIQAPKKRNLPTERLRITHICNSLDLGGPLDLTHEVLFRNYQLGYLDVRKTFGFYDGMHYYIPCDDYRRMLAEFGEETMTGLEQAALLYEIPRDTAYGADDFLRALRVCRQTAAERYVAERERIGADGIVAAVRSGSLMRLKNMPPAVRLSLMMELLTDMRKNGNTWSVPLKFFRTVDSAAYALLRIEDSGM